MTQKRKKTEYIYRHKSVSFPPRVHRIISLGSEINPPECHMFLCDGCCSTEGVQEVRRCKRIIKYMETGVYFSSLKNKMAENIICKNKPLFKINLCCPF